MKLEKLKSIPADLIPGVTLDTEIINGTVKSITILRDGAFIAKFHQPSSYESLDVLVAAKPEMVEKWTLRGQVQGLSVDEVFATEWEAKDRKTDLSCHLDGDKFDLTIALAQVPEPE
jgi:hypothetical protein